MTSAEYLETIVLPCVSEYVEAPIDRRKAYIACITAAHLIDYVARTPLGGGHSKVRNAIDADGFYSAGARQIVEGICNGTKHAGPARTAAFPFTPGWERPREAFGWDVDGAGWDQAKWDAPGLTVRHHDATWFIDECVRGLLAAFKRVFPSLFVDVNFDTARLDLDRWARTDEPEQA